MKNKGVTHPQGKLLYGLHISMGVKDRKRIVSVTNRKRIVSVTNRKRIVSVTNRKRIVSVTIRKRIVSVRGKRLKNSKSFLAPHLKIT